MDLASYDAHRVIASLALVIPVALRLWELKNENDSARRLWAQGYDGVGQLALYLSVVCGFHVAVRLDQGDVVFGDESRLVEVVIAVDRESSGKWETGYLLDDCSIQDHLFHILSGENNALEIHRKSSFFPTHKSTYTVSDTEVDINSPKAVNPLDLQAWKRRLEKAGLSDSISARLRDHLSTGFRYTNVVSDEELVSQYQKLSMTERSLKDKQFQVGIVRSTNRRQALSERLAAASKIWNLKTIQEDDVDELTESVATGKGKSKHYKYLNKFLPGKSVRSLCQYGRHGEEIAEGIEDTCHLVHLNSWLKDFAVKLWLLAHLDPNSQRILLTIGPNRDWKIPNIKLNKESYRDFVFTKMLLSAVAMRLVGRSISITCPSPLALVAGGAVIGLRGNEARPILEDVGHSILVTPGSIELPERRAKEVYQPQIRRKNFTPSKCLDINGIQRPCDGFGEAKSNHVLEFPGYVAELKSVLQIGENVLYLDALRAIDIASRRAAQEGCLVECASR